MTSPDRLMLWAAMTASLFAVLITLELFWLGQPPTHCRYLVPVAKHPGVYGCSQYPRPRKVAP